MFHGPMTHVGARKETCLPAINDICHDLSMIICFHKSWLGIFSIDKVIGEMLLDAIT